MSESIEARAEHYRSKLPTIGQEHLLRFWDELDPEQRTALLDDLDAVDFDLVTRLIPTHVTDHTPAVTPETLMPPEVMPATPDIDLVGRYADAIKQGVGMIRQGMVAALTVAGGQGTRLGLDGPKGAFAISPVRGKTLFQLFAEAVAATQLRYGGTVPWYIMTSPVNDAATQKFFTDNDHFGLNPERILFFPQGVMPAFAPDGKILLDCKHRLALSPDGHGGTLRALAASGALATMKSQGAEAISYFQVDNPLVKPIDPLFLGLTRITNAEMAAKVIPKADDFERVGVVAQADGKTQVIEYSDLADELATARDENGNRTFDAGSIAVHVLARSFVERLTGGSEGLTLPWHRASKKVAYTDETGTRIEPDEPNAIKLETFIFDALPLAKKTLVLQTRREEEFSPVKNAEGGDSPETSRRDLNRRAARWLDSAGVNVPVRPDGEPDATLEISPLLALDPNQLRERLPVRPDIQPGASVYLD
jgi:UDP-N-acetylglucosamine/UDP-N-acetylgalactosamine diphosphorylase